MACDQNSMTSFLHCPCLGDRYSFVELSFHAGAVLSGDCYWEINNGLHGYHFLDQLDGSQGPARRRCWLNIWVRHSVRRCGIRPSWDLSGLSGRTRGQLDRESVARASVEQDSWQDQRIRARCPAWQLGSLLWSGATVSGLADPRKLCFRSSGFPWLAPGSC